MNLFNNQNIINNLNLLKTNRKKNYIKPIVIIQTSPARTCSTFLVNMLYGFFIPNQKIRGYWNLEDKLELFNYNINIYKSHILDIEKIINKYSNLYELYFICSERDNNKIEDKYKKLINVIIFDYNELNETHTLTLIDIINNAYNKLINKLPLKLHYKLNKNSAIWRINEMNKRYKEIENMPFTYVDPFFELHGRHKNRDNKDNN